MQPLITTVMQEDDDDKAFIHNHLRFTILYHRDIETDLSRIVGFEVEPFSVQHKVSKGPCSIGRVLCLK